MKIYTKTGDTGTTSLISGRRISKADLRIEVFGTVDELNSYVGLVRDQSVNENRRSLLKEIQDRLFTIGSHLADDPERHSRKPLPDLQREDVTLIELAIDAMEQELPALRHFVLPGGHPSVSFAHLARTVCRRAERQVVLLSEKAQVEDIIIQYLNRLSDYFFVLSRKMAQELQVEEVKWIPRV
ncbi:MULTISPECIES: cob(I)yrinic acid a,c-diamide adenosyltransferase [unclassified Siphonobacter]|uniref:cob(I)yrinic acid a,c-diamide adenosyltransferase n=1 Tax=unclassified Siphonobacter TaxID=2635712 RepID=UPI000CAF3EB7|nr:MULTISPECIES: cob(I)yrinic acid a,c-diamide adenosyltransferase [unclassified Siphonobacter]MDQ1088657.1 cob(I)alamin adenosyltransferase [Siphonobacter sp. SORGH_AS_1065]PKK35075.1 ATP:cob(I)alamin adenosyltransferase [Siphonobacter sp. SORGH_AS_0500]